MCIIFWSQSDQYQLILAANRDEFLSRPTTSAAFHGFESTDLSRTPDAARPVLSGLDLEGGGTWLGVSLPDAFPSSGTGERLRFATLTNFTETIPVGKRPSRGALVKDWLYGRVEEGMSGYLDRVEQRKEEYAGFNLLLGSVGREGKWEMGYVSNRGEEKARKVIMPRQGSATGLSNATLGEVQGEQRWPKVQQGCQAVEEAVKEAEAEEQLVAKLWDVLSTAHPSPIRHRSHLRYTTLVQPTFLDPKAPLPANPPPFADPSSATPAPPPAQLPPGWEGKVEGEGGYWYGTRVQTLLLVEREREGRCRVVFKERDAYVLDAQGSPKWCPAERTFEFVV